MNINEISMIAGAVGIILAVIQLRLSYRQSRTSFEDDIAKEYRQLASTLPTTALLGTALNEEDYRSVRDEFYRYFDFCNGQIFLRQYGRVTRFTWFFWCDGIRTNMQRPAFIMAWNDISTSSNTDFSEFRRLISENFKTDPRFWDSNFIKRIWRSVF